MNIKTKTVRQDTQWATEDSKRVLKISKNHSRGTGKNPRSLVRQGSIHRQAELGTVEIQARFRQKSKVQKQAERSVHG